MRASCTGPFQVAPREGFVNLDTPEERSVLRMMGVEKSSVLDAVSRGEMGGREDGFLFRDSGNRGRRDSLGPRAGSKKERKSNGGKIGFIGTECSMRWPGKGVRVPVARFRAAG